MFVDCDEENLLHVGHVNRERNNDLDDEYHGSFFSQHRLFLYCLLS